MLYELSIREVMTLRAACVAAQVWTAENAESSEHCANNPNMTEDERAIEFLVAMWYKNQKADFEAVRKALDKGRELTTLEQAKEALER